MHTSYLVNSLNPVYIKKIVDGIKTIINEYIGVNSFDAIAFCGMSGALVTPIIAYALNKYPMLIRKTTDNHHSSFRIEVGSDLRDIKNIIIIDDFISSGYTIEFIIDKIKDTYNEYFISCPNCIGVILYDNFSLTLPSRISFLNNKVLGMCLDKNDNIKYAVGNKNFKKLI